MVGRHSGADRRGLGLRWLAGGVVLTIAGAITLALAPAGADTKTVNAELSFSGIATTANLLGGSQIGVHPGDTVDFTPSTIPTAGLTNIPALGTALDSLLQTLLGSATGYQITVHFPANFPGGARDVTMGACSTIKSLPVTFPKAGSFDFTWSAVSISPLCVLPADIGSLAGDQLKTAGIALNATNQWVGRILVGTNVTEGGVSIQLPGVSLAPSLPGIGQLPTLGLSGINLPTLPITIPNVGGASGSSSTSSSGSYSYSPPALTVPQMVVPHPDDGTAGEDGEGAGDTGNGSFGSPLPITTSGGTISRPPATSTAPTASASKPAKHVALASSNKLDSAGIPVLLMIIAILALATVTGTYARLYMVRNTH